MVRLQGQRVTLRTAEEEDIPALVAIRATPEVLARWRGTDFEGDVRESIQSEEVHVLVIENDALDVVGSIQWEAEEEPDYRHAGIDMYLHPDLHNRGFGTDATRTLCHHLFEAEGHHRLTIDPAADNHAAIRCYEKAGFKRVGIMRQYERGGDGTFHDGLLMDMLRDDLAGASCIQCDILS